MSKILERILAAAGSPDLLEVLAERLSPADLQSLLLEVYRRRAARLSPGDLLRQYERDRFVAPSPVSPLRQLEFDRMAYGLLPPGYAAIELAPVAPLGASSAVATVSQNKVLSTSRNSEVTSDTTNVLALECARRRRAAAPAQRHPQGSRPTRLCASQRVLRAQQFSGPAMLAHFRLLSLCAAGRDSGSYGFEIAALVEQIGFYLRLFAAAQAAGYALDGTRVTLTAFDEARLPAIQAAVIDPLAASFPAVGFGLDQGREAGRGYYASAGFHIYARDAAGAEFFLADGGFTDWTQRLLSDRKERLLISGLGSERFILCFGGGDDES
jgi:hypothetical protein